MSRTRQPGPGRRAILFDLDGTLVDTTARIRAAWGDMMASHGFPEPDDWPTVYASTVEQLLAPLSDDAQRRVQMGADYRAQYHARTDVPAPLYDGVAAAVEELARRGYPLAVVTNKGRGGALAGLAEVGLAHAFRVVVTASDVANPKPHPEPVLRALAELGVAAAQACFVGDAPGDLAAGRAAGVRTVAVRWGPCPHERLAAAGPDHWAATAADLVAIAGAEAPGRVGRASRMS